MSLLVAFAVLGGLAALIFISWATWKLGGCLDQALRLGD